MAGGIDLAQVGGRGDDLGAGRVVRAAHVLAQLFQAGLRFVDQPDQCRYQLVEVVRRHIGGHAHGDAGGAVEQQVRQPCRHPGRLFQGAVEVRVPVGGAMAELAQQHFGQGGELGFGVAHGRKRLRVIGRAEVALAVDQRVTVGKRLGHQHQRFVTGAVTVRVVFTDHITDGTRRLLVLGRGAQAELAHRIDDAALHRFQAVTDERQCAVQNHIHGVVQVGTFGVFAQRQLLKAVERRTGKVGHAGNTSSLRRAAPSAGTAR